MPFSFSIDTIRKQGQKKHALENNHNDLPRKSQIMAMIGDSTEFWC